MAVAKELVRVAKELVAVPMSYDTPTTETTRWVEKTLRLTLNADASWRKIYELFMTVEEGTSNKFHYFAVFRSRTGECAGGNAYGRIGYNPKAIEVARGSEGSVMADVRAKASAKQRSRGYQVREV
jgi:hypothetical protein